MGTSFLIANSYPTRTQEIIVKYICTLHSSVNEQKKQKLRCDMLFYNM